MKRTKDRSTVQHIDTIVVFTARSQERIIREGGSKAWLLNLARAKQCSFVVCTQNQHNPKPEFSDATAPHGSAFLVGKISAIRPVPDGRPGRCIIEISEYARINLPDVWDHGRNPVRYTSLAELGITLDTLKFQTMPATSAGTTGKEVQRPPSDSAPASLTIAAAKKALAATFGVSPDAVEITIRG